MSKTLRFDVQLKKGVAKVKIRHIYSDANKAYKAEMQERVENWIYEVLEDQLSSIRKWMGRSNIVDREEEYGIRAVVLDIPDNFLMKSKFTTPDLSRFTSVTTYFTLNRRPVVMKMNLNQLLNVVVNNETFIDRLIVSDTVIQKED